MTITLDAISLPADLLWQDEFDWYPVAQTQDRSLSGAFLVQEAAITYGRPITLVGEEGSWVPRSDMMLLQAKANTADLQMVLDYHGTTYDVIFDRSNGPPVTGRQVFRLMNPDNDWLYEQLTIKLLTVEP